eukprot:NODE_647_length_1429_cov_265.631732.p1 GENE.NODE_647_length_1429_cov_265.631732~~NODE_647_length_1429_cov_265.631732.p1  ORF type:complete len:428 (+),score=85.53 NODE_647_length_1429_cov_265.631732:3-1286(+)
MGAQASLPQAPVGQAPHSGTKSISERQPLSSTAFDMSPADDAACGATEAYVVLQPEPYDAPDMAEAELVLPFHESGGHAQISIDGTQPDPTIEERRGVELRILHEAGGSAQMSITQSVECIHALLTRIHQLGEEVDALGRWQETTQKDLKECRESLAPRHPVELAATQPSPEVEKEVEVCGPTAQKSEANAAEKVAPAAVADGAKAVEMAATASPSIADKVVGEVALPLKGNGIAKGPTSKGPDASARGKEFGGFDNDNAERVVWVKRSSGALSAKWQMSAADLNNPSACKLLSPSFTMGELENVSIIVDPVDGGSFRLKVLFCPFEEDLEFCLIFGSEQSGPLKHNFRNSSICGPVRFDPICMAGERPIIEVRLPCPGDGDDMGAWARDFWKGVVSLVSVASQEWSKCVQEAANCCGLRDAGSEKR